ncbi:MAG: hypothetical protein M5U23_10215 [Acidimicrobiia bacterium]|nr:hypothetical protein [Acidimicrobiia bacterium]
MSTHISEQKTNTNRSRTPWFAAAAAVAAAIVAVSVIAVGPKGEQPVASTPLALTAGESNTLASCIMMTPEIIAESEVAFAGIVTAIDGETVTLEVTKWYAGGDNATVIVTAPAGFEALIGNVPFAEGGNFLVSATDGVVNYCGMSGEATAELQALYDAAFPE